MADSTGNTVSATAPVSADVKPVPADYQRTVDVSRHTTEHVHGSKTTFDTETKTDDSAGGVIDNRLLSVIDGEIVARANESKAEEDARANKRNMNRIYLMLSVLVMELFLPTLAGMGLLPLIFIKYEVLLITAPDALLTIWAFHRKY